MGVWGPGNFDGDLPRDFIAYMIACWERDIEKVFAGELPDEAVACGLVPGFDAGLGCLIPLVEISIAVAEKLECDYLPSPETVRRWSALFLQWFDAEIETWKPDPRFRDKKRRVISDTFDRLLQLAEAKADENGSREP
jgi:hypothetical protein